MARPSNRELILDTFEGILLTEGPSSATLDAVAEQAGVSKGGLIYHFPSKAALLAGFGQRVLDRIDEAIGRKPKGHDFIIDRRTKRPAVSRHMSVTGG